MAALRAPVFLEYWQIECCGTPPGVGDQVAWTLLFTADEPGEVPDPKAGVTLDAIAVPAPDGVGPTSGGDAPAPGGGAPVGGGSGVEVPVRLDCGGLHALWVAAGRFEGPVRVAGQLSEEHHGGIAPDFPRTTGTVARVRVVTRRFVLDPMRDVWVPGPQPPAYRDVGRSPKWFADQLGDGGPKEVGVLVDLVVDEPGTRAT